MKQEGFRAHSSSSAPNSLRVFLASLLVVIASQGLQAQQPNIVFVLADDLGFTDLAPYGGEIHTPTISRLASAGIRFANYHTAANCAPARAMLMTGVNNHLAGVANIPEMIAPQQRSHPSYQGVLGENVVTVATLLEGAGYHTYMAGKWHLGATPEKRPSRRGFERTVALMDSGADNWEQRPYLPIYEQANWFADGERMTLPEDFYSSEFLIDKTIEFIDENLQDGKPFFAYVPFQAVHIPVQAPKEFTQRYTDVYDRGWTELRAQRRLRAQALGIIPTEAEMAVMSRTQEWASLSEARKRFEAKRMAVYAGMVEAMDFHLGRLVAYLEAHGQMENTVFVVTSDNGAEASGPDDPNSFLAARGVARLGYHQDYERLGQKGSYNTISPSFASAAASPLAYYKFYTGEGGMRVPLIITGTQALRRQGVASDLASDLAGGVSHAFAWATDIAPTLLALADVPKPGPRYAGRPVLPMTGKNLVPLLDGSATTVYATDESVGYELTGHAALFKGGYKLVRHYPPQGDGQWRLYHIDRDPGEVVDLAQTQIARFQQMRAEYEDFAKTHGVLPPPAGYSQSGQLVANYLSTQTRTGFLVVLLTLLVLLPFYVAYRMR